MSFVPLTGPATFRAADPPRDSVVTFTGPARTVDLPVRAALPVLTRAHADPSVHPSVGLLAGTALLAVRLVAAGGFAPASEGDAWSAVLGADDHDRLTMLARARAHEEMDADEAYRTARAALDAIVDTLPRTPPSAGRGALPRARPGVGRPQPPERPAPVERTEFTERLRARIASVRRQVADPGTLAQLVTVSLRVEADEEELLAGSVRLVLQVHDQRDPARFCEAGALWRREESAGGFGERARTHAAIALRDAAGAWPVLDRFGDLAVPDEITLDGDEIASLLEDGVAALRERDVDVLWPRSLGRDLTTRAVVEHRPRSDGKREDLLYTGLFGTESLFGFSWQVALGGEALTHEEMDELASAASPVIKLRGSWTVVDPAVARRARKRLVRGLKPAEAVAAALTGVVEVDDAPAEVIVGASLLKARERLLAAATREPVPTPAALQATLRDYQRHGLTWLAELTGLGLGACLADDMGLGKTVTLIALHLHRLEQERPPEAPAPGPTLVVCPASLLGNWEAEIRRFAPGTPVRRFHGQARSLDPVAGTDPGFVLTTYGTLRSDLAGQTKALAGVRWGLVVADEAQHVKNPASSTARSLRRLDTAARVALTGTPVENDLTELWAILDWATPGLLGSRNAFRRAWAAPIESGADPAKARQFADLIGPFLLRRRKSDPGIAPELPPKTETDHLLDLTREQVVLYEAYVRDCMERIERADEDSRRGLVLAMLTGLKQICNHPAHFLKQTSGRIAGRSEKVDLLDELLPTLVAEGSSVLVFTQYVAMARILAQHLEVTGVPHQLLHGGTSVAERERMVAAFQAGPEADGPPVFLLSLKAGGTGLNLTRADHVVHLDRWWNPAVEEQATDRAYRIGQTRPVQVHRFVTRGTIEERVAELLQRKRALADAVLARGEGALTELGDAELRELVALRRDGRP
ncbi:DEAD/DEAH box helicase [Nocardioides zeae]|uniref:DEAD/DEAH box helicase n=1 Tax=Nocardioides imazamoxiresistens TaxID=3231893 RepID=A0ABU3PVE7_9ACTN|nr:DEAD/DEAH box helicase [Nocardioides zeae]MDT9593195.1 DEAD/DEAH box helicase [Nocardioides zeae]